MCKILDSWLSKTGQIGCPARCVITQKSAVLVYFAAKAWNYSLYIVLVNEFMFLMLQTLTISYSLIELP
jgi:hypothetical protein